MFEGILQVEEEIINKSIYETTAKTNHATIIVKQKRKKKIQ